MRILVYDADHASRSSVTDLLRAIGHEPLEARDHHDALRLAAGEVDLLVADFFGPQLDGLELAQAIAARRGRPLPTVLLTFLTARQARRAPGPPAPAAIVRKPVQRRAMLRALAAARRDGA